MLKSISFFFFRELKKCGRHGPRNRENKAPDSLSFLFNDITVTQIIKINHRKRWVY